MSETSSAYTPKEIEEKWNQYWFSEGLFNLKIKPGAPVFSVALPPPNITGNLHMGHALNGTIQDVLCRWKRMNGYSVHWQPGTDHAGISTQMVVERQLKKEGKNRHALGREKFLESCWQWRNQYGNTIYSQYKRLGVSFSWDRLMFTMDEAYVRSIYRAFSILYKEGFIYRGKRVTNWCPRCQTSLSDLEVEHEEVKGSLYLIKYKLEKDETKFVTVATTRPESIFGDVAVAINPKDQRYSGLAGQKVRIPLTQKTIPIIEDAYVDTEFGTGALKITPAHDVNDWEIGQRHKLEQPTIIDHHAKMSVVDLVPKEFQGLDRFEARKLVVQELEQKDLLQETRDYVHGLGHCERCHTAIEPLLSDQWYVQMKELAKPAIEVVENGRVTFVPSRYAATYLNWMRNIRDWCISRQLWWGHRIPIWKCDDCSFEDAFENIPDKCTKCGSAKFIQDPDVLDTWFSSALWPFATLGWPEQTEDLKTFYPTSILSTAREIINLWVARMIFTGLKFAGDIPFKEVLIHPVIQTGDGKRMSKSKGNAVDPLETIEKYGADANRFWFASLGIKGDQDVRFREERLLEYQKFINKIWNAGKFVLRNIEGHEIKPIDRSRLSLADRWILSKHSKLLSSLDKSLANYDFDNACRDIYEFTWDYFCDWYLEIAKRQIDSSGKTGESCQTRNVLHYIFESLMRAMHPITPYVTEELWQRLALKEAKDKPDSIMFAQYPQADTACIDEQADADMDFLMRVIRSFRDMKHLYGVDAKQKAEVLIQCNDSRETNLLSQSGSYIEWLANVSAPSIVSNGGPQGKTASDNVSSAKLYLPLEKLINVDEIKGKLALRVGKCSKQISEKRGLFDREDFRKKAPPEKVSAMAEEIRELEQQLNSLQTQIKVLEG
ncbi:MAG: valine--tRNA ligase [Candidatus Obscuribacterales bacterium]|nr:valine--tRNA ligase [Candidatus Obscuribacterales bacterium]